MNKKLLGYFVFIAIDVIGYLTIYFFVITHLILVIFITTNFYQYISKIIDKNSGKYSKVISGILAFLLTIFAALIYWFTYKILGEKFNY